MKKIIAIVLCLVLLVSISSAMAGNAGSESDPLISLNYLESFGVELYEKLENFIHEKFDKEEKKISSIGNAEQNAEEHNFELTYGFESFELSRGGTLTAQNGSTVVLLSGTAAADSGSIVNLTKNKKMAEGELLEVNNKYFMEENDRILSYSDASLLADGAFEEGKKEIPPETPVELQFDDIGSHWAKNEILALAKVGLVSGVGNDKFQPDATMTRAMFVTVLGRCAAVNQKDYSSAEFKDVAAGEWYSPYVTWAAENGIVSGYGNGIFGPNDPITREQMALIIMRFADNMGAKLAEVSAESTFADETKISTWAQEAVHMAQRTGLIKGKNGNAFDPQGTASRAEVCTVVYRFVSSAIL